MDINDFQALFDVAGVRKRLRLYLWYC